MNQQGEGIRWKAADIQEVDRAREEAGKSFLEFIRVPDLSVGLYVLEAGVEDLGNRLMERTRSTTSWKGRASSPLAEKTVWWLPAASST